VALNQGFSFAENSRIAYCKQSAQCDIPVRGSAMQHNFCCNCVHFLSLFLTWNRGFCFHLLVKLSNQQTPCKPRGSETLPRGIVSSTSDLKLRPLWDSHNTKVQFGRSLSGIFLASINSYVMKFVHLFVQSSNSTNLLAIPVGIRQKDNVDKIVKKVIA